MIERLYFADLVLADMTIPNGNVYYEVGIRHAAKEIGCVLLAAEWSKALFDVAQMRTLRYPLPEGSIRRRPQSKIRTAIKGPIDSLGRGVSPIFESIPGYPSDGEAGDRVLDEGRDGRTRRVSGGNPRGPRPAPTDRDGQGQELVDKYWKPPVTGATVIAVASPPQGFRRRRRRLELDYRFHRQVPGRYREPGGGSRDERLRHSNAGKPIEAIAKLEELITRSGPTPRTSRAARRPLQAAVRESGVAFRTGSPL